MYLRAEPNVLQLHGLLPYSLLQEIENLRDPLGDSIQELAYLREYLRHSLRDFLRQIVALTLTPLYRGHKLVQPKPSLGFGVGGSSICGFRAWGLMADSRQHPSDALDPWRKKNRETTLGFPKFWGFGEDKGSCFGTDGSGSCSIAA